MHQVLTLHAVLKKIKYLNENTDWGVYQFSSAENGNFVAQGTLGPQYPGYQMVLHGTWEKNPKGGGVLFVVKHYRVTPPTTEEGIYLFLTSGLIKGMTKKIAKTLIDQYGERTLGLMKGNINIVTTVPGVGVKTFIKIREAFFETLDKYERIATLQQRYLFTMSESLHIIKTLPENALNLIERSPYSVYRRLSKIPFLRFDKLIIASGFNPLDKQRIREVILHQMRNCFSDGHTVIRREDIIQNSVNYLQLDRYQIEIELDWLLKKGWIVCINPHDAPYHQYLQNMWLHLAEKEIATRLAMISTTPAEKQLIFDENDPRLDRLKRQQRKAAEAPFYHKVSVITGRPGAGKTTLLRTLLDLLESQNLNVIGVSPTGKAAQRLREVTGRDCKTIHRALGATHESDEFVFNDVYPLDVDVILIDETSMLDTPILRSLLRATPYTARIIFIGDVEQLPSVGPGAVFRDMINSGCFAVYWLTEVLRITKADGSLPSPLAAAEAVRNGKEPRLPNDEEWEYHPTNSNLETQIAIKNVIAQLSAKGVSYQDIQVFSPVNHDEMGVDKLNILVKKAFFERGKDEIEEKDKIMQKENNYDLNVYNGDIGTVISFYEGERTAAADDPVMLCDMAGRTVEYCKKHLYHISLAYVISGHKSQGSEYPYVIIAIPEHHFGLMDRFWLYTLITRCQKKVYLIGNPRVIQQTVRSKRSHQRKTHLIEKIRQFNAVCNLVFN